MTKLNRMAEPSLTPEEIKGWEARGCIIRNYELYWPCPYCKKELTFHTDFPQEFLTTRGFAECDNCDVHFDELDGPETYKEFLPH